MANLNIGRKSGFIVRGGVRRRETIWFGGTPFQQVLAATTSAAIVATLNAAALALRPFTVIRSRGVLLVQSDQAVTGEDYAASFGMAVVSEQAAALGITAVPTPTIESNSDLWFTYEFIVGAFQFASASGFVEVGRERMIDSRAMRKVEDGQDIIQVVEGGGGAADSGQEVAGFVRMLIKLH